MNEKGTSGIAEQRVQNTKNWWRTYISKSVAGDIFIGIMLLMGPLGPVIALILLLKFLYLRFIATPPNNQSAQGVVAIPPNPTSASGQELTTEQALFACLRQREKLGDDINSSSVAEATSARFQQILMAISRYSAKTGVKVFDSRDEVLEAAVMIHQITLMGANVEVSVQRFMDSLKQQKGL